MYNPKAKNKAKAWIFTHYTQNDLESMRGHIQPDDFIVGVDQGMMLLIKNNIPMNCIVGDFDSVDQDLLETIKHHPECFKYSPEKDETDAELALKICLDKGFSKIFIINNMQGRTDHVLGILGLMEYAFEKRVRISVISAEQYMFIAEQSTVLDYAVDTEFSLCPLSAEVTGVKTLHCQYPLNQETLYREKSRGISNVIKKQPAEIFINRGALLVIINGGWNGQ